MNIKLIALSLLILAISCNQSKTKQTNTASNNNRTAQTTIHTEKKYEKHLNIKETLELLQGKWQHIQDTSNYLVFVGNYRKETAGGMNGWDEEEFSLSNTCLNDSDKDNGIEKEEAKYLRCIKSDLCWYIVELDKENLTLSYMGRGNTLTYKRMK